MLKIAANDLKELIVKTLKSQSRIENEVGNPFYIKIEGKEYLFFIKNISPAYFKHNLDITRIQIPSSKHFQNLKEMVPIIVIGYDDSNDVIIVWDPLKIKPRLNNKSNVSLYSRQSYQDNVNYTDIHTRYLSNNDKILLSKRKNILTLINSIPFEFKLKTVNKDNTSLRAEKNLEIENVITKLGNAFVVLIRNGEKLATTELLFGELEKNKINCTLKECYNYLSYFYFNNSND